MMYVILEYLVNQQSGILQRPATTLHYYEKPQRSEQEKVMERLAAHPPSSNFLAENMVTPGDRLEWVSFRHGAFVAHRIEKLRPAWTLCAVRLPAQTGSR